MCDTLMEFTCYALITELIFNASPSSAFMVTDAFMLVVRAEKIKGVSYWTSWTGMMCLVLLRQPELWSTYECVFQSLQDGENVCFVS